MEVIVYAGIVILAFYTGIMSIGYYNYTLIPFTMNIGKDLHYKDMQYVSTLKYIAVIGTKCNLQVCWMMFDYECIDHHQVTVMI